MNHVRAHLIGYDLGLLALDRAALVTHRVALNAVKEFFVLESFSCSVHHFCRETDEGTF